MTERERRDLGEFREVWSRLSPENKERLRKEALEPQKQEGSSYG